MIAWLVIEGRPRRVFYNDDRALAFIDPAIAKYKLLESLGTLGDSSEDNAETQNVSIKLSLEARVFFLDDPPIGEQATIDSDQGEQFAGTVQTVAISATEHVAIGIEQ